MEDKRREKDEYQLCVRCVMDTSDPQIVFDPDGHCNHCIDFLENRSRFRFEGAAGEKRLGRMVEEIKRAGRGNAYDCILGMSGGVDSSYAAYLMHERGLRPLAVHMDNGWDSNESVANIKAITTTLRIDYQSYVLDWEEFRDLQVCFLKASVPEAETPTDVAIPVALHHFASKYNVKYIVSAGNLTTEGILPKSWHYNAKDLRYLRYIQRTFGTTTTPKRSQTFDYKKEAYFKLVKGIKFVYPLNCIRFSKDSATDVLTETFGYRSTGEKHHESRYTRFIQSYYLYEKFGIDYRRSTASSEICSGLISREAALEKLKKLPYEPAEIALEKQYIAKKLHLSLDEFDSIIALPPKWYWDYPNDERKLGKVYDSYLKLFRKKKMSNY